jgi:hypothetical protein
MLEFASESLPCWNFVVSALMDRMQVTNYNWSVILLNISSLPIWMSELVA